LEQAHGQGGGERITGAHCIDHLYGPQVALGPVPILVSGLPCGPKVKATTAHSNRWARAVI
jgi:hypothetical protein